MSCMLAGPLSKEGANGRGFVYTLSALLLLIILFSSSLLISFIFLPVIEPCQPDQGLQRQIYRSILIGGAVSATQADIPDLAAINYIEKSFEALASINEFEAIRNDGGAGEGKQLPEINLGGMVQLFEKAYRPGGGSVAYFKNIPQGYALAVFGLNISCLYISDGTEIAVDLQGAISEVAAAIYSNSSQSWSYIGTLSASKEYVVNHLMNQIEAIDLGYAINPAILKISGVPPFSLIKVADGSGNVLSFAVKGRHSEIAIIQVIAQQLPFYGSMSVRCPLAVEGNVLGGYVYVLY
ncbi:MAG: hypothetical protein NO516_02195 [Candidatus Methanomethylicia archaeon]|nr:hypothetical protein [Candidatus Methanomethylicia archaeon]